MTTRHDTHAIAEALARRLEGRRERTINEAVWFGLEDYDATSHIDVQTNNIGCLDIKLTIRGLDLETTEEILDLLVRRSG